MTTKYNQRLETSITYFSPKYNKNPAVFCTAGFFYVENCYSILDKNAFRRGCFGLVNSSCGGSSS